MNKNYSILTLSALTFLSTASASQLDELQKTFLMTPAEITASCDEGIQLATTGLDRIAKVSASSRNLENTLLAFESVTADLGDLSGRLTFPGYVSTNPDASAAASQCEEKLGQYLVEVYTRRDLYDAIKNQTGRSAQESRLLSETLKSFKLNGLDLDDSTLIKVRELKQKLSTLESAFSKNLNEDVSSIDLTELELKGVSADFLSRLKKTPDGKYTVTTKSTDYSQVMDNAESSDARKKMLSAYENRAGNSNTKLLSDAVNLRREIAKLLGFKTWADYRTQGRMAKDAQTVSAFLNNLKTKLALRNKKDLQVLLDFKKKTDPAARAVDAWDIRYLSNQVKKEKFTLDEDEIKKYFPADVVTKGMFEIYSQILGVKFVEVIGAPVWSAEVKMYETRDASTGKLLSYFFTDLYPRAGKYGHAAAFPLIQGRVINGSYNYPVASIVANLEPPTNGKPALVRHDEVKTMFHEFGHIMHQTLTKAPYASLSGSAVAQDFVEAPSQMLENWVWQKEPLKILSGLYTDPSQKLPEDLLNKMLAAKDFNQGYFYCRQLVFGLFDMTLHTSEVPLDINQTYRDIHTEMFGIEPVSGSQFPASFGHLMGGYDAGYYGYLWSAVYAQDMFTVFEKGGTLSPTVGASYRRNILETGNMVEPIDFLSAFLGRLPNTDAFFKKLGI